LYKPFMKAQKKLRLKDAKRRFIANLCITKEFRNRQQKPKVLN
jgi:hypothetical protein